MITTGGLKYHTIRVDWNGVPLDVKGYYERDVYGEGFFIDAPIYAVGVTGDRVDVSGLVEDYEDKISEIALHSLGKAWKR